MGTNSLSTMAPRRLWWVTCVVALTLVLNTVEAGANNLGHDTNEGLSNEISDASLTATTASDANEEVSNEATNSDHINANANNLGHDTNAMAHEAATPSASVLRAELSALKLGGLNRRAVAANVDPDALEMAHDKGDKAAIIELVLQSNKPLASNNLSVGEVLDVDADRGGGRRRKSKGSRRRRKSKGSRRRRRRKSKFINKALRT